MQLGLLDMGKWTILCGKHYQKPDLIKLLKRFCYRFIIPNLERKKTKA
jgi:hypothetical protein